MANYKDIDPSFLTSIKNPVSDAYEIKIKVPECTFLGVHEQPDFADLYFVFYPGEKVIELKSLKQYIFQLRSVVVSYERLINVIYEQMMCAFEPQRLRVVMICNPRGGISSRLTIDSDWKVRGGDERFVDWQHGAEETWTVAM